MLNKRKIVNDPVYGFINIPFPVLFDLMEHPYFQRLRRIKQLGLTSLVYPGANHTRFQHALGAMHLMEEAIKSLRSKGVDISDCEFEAALVAILLHDIGHGPYSHAMENVLTEGIAHETLSLMFMQQLSRGMGNKLNMAIQIFRNEYPKKFLCRLVSGQLDMDRMDYLRRDSFFTGVTEGIIGSDRIIKMLNVHDGKLVIEAKGVYSIEKFLLARRLMYWQVYLHKTVIAADQMLLSILARAKELLRIGESVFGTSSLLFFLRDFASDTLDSRPLTIISHYNALDDNDIIVALKMWSTHIDPVLSRLSSDLLNRKLFRIEIQNQSFDEGRINELKRAIAERGNYSAAESAYFVRTGILTNHAYCDHGDDPILVMQNGSPVDLTVASDLDISGMSKVVEKHFLCYPKELTRP